MTGRNRVRDEPERPDQGFAELYASLPDATDLEPWLGWCRKAGGAVLYLGIGAGRLAVPLLRQGVRLVGVDAHPGMLERVRDRAPEIELVQARIEDLRLGRRFELVLAPSNILCTADRLAGAGRHVARGGRLAFELMNPYWLSAGAEGVRVLAMDHAACRIEIDYPGGFTQEADVPLVWPEEIEDFLAPCGLTLRHMGGSGDDLETSPTFLVLAEPAEEPDAQVSETQRPPGAYKPPS